MLRQVLLRASRSDGLGRVARRLPLADEVARRLVVGARVEDAVRVMGPLLGGGLSVSLDHVGDLDPTGRGPRLGERDSYQAAVRAVVDAGLAGPETSPDRVDLCLRLAALTAPVPQDDPDRQPQGAPAAARGAGAPAAEHDSDVGLYSRGPGPVDHRDPSGRDAGRETLEAFEPAVYDQVRDICAVAKDAGVTVTLQGVRHAEVEAMLALAGELWKEHPNLGVTIRAHLHRSEADCKTLAARGVRVRLSMGMEMAPASVAFTSRLEVDRSYVRCLRNLMAGGACPTIATHDPRLIDLAQSMSHQWDRSPSDYEFQLPHGVQAALQQRLLDRGETVRVRVPYGTAWYGYLMRRTAERPASAVSVVRRRRRA